MVGRDVLDDRQPEPGAAGGAGARGVDPVEALEYALHVALGDSDALVGDRFLQPARLPRPDADHDPGALGGVGDGVVDEVGHRGDKLRFIAQHRFVLAPCDHHIDLFVHGSEAVRSSASATTADTSTG